MKKIGTLYYISRAMFTTLMKILLRVHIYGKENLPEPPFVITSNHASVLDPTLLGRVCEKYQVHFMAKRELFEAPVFGAWTEGVGCIPVDRGKNGIGPVREALRCLRQRHIVGMFPEGTRSNSGDIRDAKRGTGFLVAKAHVPVVPVYIEGSGKAMPKEGYIKLGAPVNVFVGKPITSEEYSLKDKSGKEYYEAISSLIIGKIAELKES